MARHLLVLDGPGDADRNRDGHLTATELSLSALWLGLFGSGFLLGLVGLVVVWGWGRFGLFFFLLDVAATVACAVGCWRHYAVFDRALRWASADRQRAIEQADRELQYQEGLEDTAGERISQTKIDNAARTIMRRYYAGKPWQRGKIPGMSETLWNAANEALKKAGIRNGRSKELVPESLAGAWGMYVDWLASCHTFRVGGDAELIAD